MISFDPERFHPERPESITGAIGDISGPYQGAVAASAAAHGTQIGLNRGNTDVPFVAFPARYRPAAPRR